jgi:putative glycosyltransferase (TIGR04372 family)
MLIDVEMATAELEMGINTKHPRTVHLWYPWTRGLQPANGFLLEAWKRSIRILPAWVLEPITEVNKLLPGGSRHVIPYRKGIRQLSNFNDVNGALRSTGPHLHLLESEVHGCTEALQLMGIQPKDAMVCFHIRTSRYLDGRLGAANSRGHDFRDASIGSHESTMLDLARRGFKVVRLGTEAEEPLSVNHQNLIDYACLGFRSEILDLFIPSRCKFFVGVLSGPSHIAQLFRRPLLLTNLIPLSRMMLSMDNFLFIPKQIVDGTGKPLSLSEIVELGLENVNSTAEFDGRGLSLLENTPLEVEKAAREIELRASGEWRDDNWDKDAQRRFFDLLPDYLKVGAGGGTISSSYLRDNTWFLE